MGLWENVKKHFDPNTAISKVKWIADNPEKAMNPFDWKNNKAMAPDDVISLQLKGKEASPGQPFDWRNSFNDQQLGQMGQAPINSGQQSFGSYGATNDQQFLIPGQQQKPVSTWGAMKPQV